MDPEGRSSPALGHKTRGLSVALAQDGDPGGETNIQGERNPALRVRESRPVALAVQTLT